MSTQHFPFCKCSDANCPAVLMMRKISAMPTNGNVWSIETVSGFTKATTAAVKNRLDVVQVICCQMVTGDMTEEQMRPEFERVLQGQDLYGNSVMHYFALRANDVAIKELLQVGGCMCIRNNAGQSAIDVRRTQELRMLDAQLPVAAAHSDAGPLRTIPATSRGCTSRPSSGTARRSP